MVWEYSWLRPSLEELLNNILHNKRTWTQKEVVGCKNLEAHREFLHKLTLKYFINIKYFIANGNKIRWSDWPWLTTDCCKIKNHFTPECGGLIINILKLMMKDHNSKDWWTSTLCLQLLAQSHPAVGSVNSSHCHI